MTISAKVILDSIAPSGARLTTFELTYPRFIHAELMTHRLFSRNAASSRAIPTPKKIERIRQDVARPSEWGVNQKGMQSGSALAPEDAKLAAAVWDEAAEQAMRYAEVLCGMRCENCGLYLSVCLCGGSQIKLDLHKQVPNRLLEAFDHITTVLSGTKFNNHFKLRLERGPDGQPSADPTYFELATKWKSAFDSSTPRLTHPGEWHLPYVSEDVNGQRMLASPEDIAAFGTGPLDILDAGQMRAFTSTAKKVSAARCARVSYMRQGQGDVKKNVTLHDRLTTGGHWAPLEHVATPMAGIVFVPGEKKLNATCQWCQGLIRDKDKLVFLTSDPICMKCAHGHVHSGNFHGWHQYRKEFENEAGGD